MKIVENLSCLSVALLSSLLASQGRAAELPYAFTYGGVPYAHLDVPEQIVSENADRRVSTNVWTASDGLFHIVDCTSHGTDRYFHYNYGNEKWQRGQPLVDISFIRVTATGLELPLSAWGDPALPLSLTFKDCRLGFERPQKELIRGAHLGMVSIDNLEVQGVDGPLIRLWNEKVGNPQVSASGLKGISAEVVPSSDAWSVRGI